MKHLKAVLGILICLVIIILAVQNDKAGLSTVQFRIDPYFAEVRSTSDITIYLVIIITFLFGVVSTGVYGMIERFRMKKQIKILQTEIEDKNKELDALRNLPITSDDVSSVENNHAEGAEEGDI